MGGVWKRAGKRIACLYLAITAFFAIIFEIMERSHSGRVRTLGKRVNRKVPGVRIPPSPPICTFSEIESNVIKKPSVMIMSKLAKAFGVSIEDLTK